MPTDTKPTVLEGLRERRSTLQTDWDKLIDEREEARTTFEARDDSPTSDETTQYNADEDSFRSTSETFENQISSLDERISLLAKKEERAQVAKESASPVITNVKEPAVYRRDNAEKDNVSFYRDMLAQYPQTRSHAPKGADERLKRHSEEMAEDMVSRANERKEAADSGIDTAEREFRSTFPGLHGSLEASPFERRANPSRETGHGGDMVPPRWLIDDFIPYLRAGRVVAPLCRNLPVPEGTDVVKVPSIKLGTEVAPQLMDNAGVASRDIETSYVEAPLKTLAGQEDVAIQLIEQSPNQILDMVIQEDLLAAYNLLLDQQVVLGTGTNVTQLNAGTIKGLLPYTNWEANKNYASEGEQIPSAFISGVNSNWSQIARKRYNVQNVHHVINPARAAWLASQFDGTEGYLGRPVVNPIDFPSYNDAAELGADSPAEGLIMKTPLGPNIYSTVNVPQEFTAEGLKKAGETYDVALTAKFDDVWFFESDLRTRILPEVLSGTLQIRYQVYAYVGLLVRYGPSISVASGKPFAKVENKGKANNGNFNY